MAYVPVSQSPHQTFLENDRAYLLAYLFCILSARITYESKHTLIKVLIRPSSSCTFHIKLT